jgi:response regulator RpfG family c-di-GMP phosphodiesterase
MINKKEILLLDDNEITNFYNEDVIEDTLLFDKISIFDNPIDAISSIKTKIKNNEAIPGHFIVDINMPDMSGFEFLDELEKMTEHFEEYPRIFILSTSNHPNDRSKFVKTVMAQEYLIKPLSANQLLKLFK